MNKFSCYLLSWKAAVLRKFTPQVVIERYCLKSVPNAVLYLPGKEIELQVIDEIAPWDKQWQFLKDRVWSADTRQELYKRGLWGALGVQNRWEFEYLLKHTQPVVYLNGLDGDFRRTASFEPIIEALRKNALWVMLMAREYPQIAENLGAAVLEHELPKNVYETMTDVLTRKIPGWAAAFVARLEPQSPYFEYGFVEIWRAGGNLAPLMKALFCDRDDLYQIVKTRSAAKPELNVLSAVFQYLLKQLQNAGHTGRWEREFQDWLGILETYAQSPECHLTWLLRLRSGLSRGRYPELYDGVTRLTETYAPNLLNPANRMIAMWEGQDWP